MERVGLDTLGAWVLRCNPKLRDLHAVLAPDAAPVDSWCVASNYRSALMRPGHLVLLWVSGQHPAFPRGFWGRGTVLGPTWPDSPDPDGRVQLHVPLELRVDPDGPVTDRELRSLGVDDLEVQRMPQGSNPSWVSQVQLAQIDRIRSDR